MSILFQLDIKKPHKSTAHPHINKDLLLPRFSSNNLCPRKSILHEMGYEFRSCRSFFMCCVFTIVVWFSELTFAIDTISRGEVIRDGESLVSAGDRFELGFFTPQNSSFRYVGIWYRRAPNDSVVWVANRERPISGNNGVLTFGSDGNLLVLDGNNNTIWSSNVTVRSDNGTAVLMETGNLVLYESSRTSPILFQSFDIPTDTYLPDMRVHMNDREGERRVFTSWRSSNDPSHGNYSLGLDPRGSPQIVIWEGGNRIWRSGHWSGITFIGITGVRAVILSGFRLFNEGNGRYYFIYTLSNSSDLIRFWLTWDGTERQEVWNYGRRAWDLIQSHPVIECDRYNECGQFATCNQTRASRCSCLEGFVPRDGDEWSRGNWSGGCVRRSELRCGERGNELEDGFIRVRNAKLPDFVERHNEDGAQCERRCLANCSCTAYAFVTGINCMIWNQELVDVQLFEDGGNTLFVRVARSELRQPELGGRNQVRRNLIIIIVTVASFFLCISIWIIWKKRQKCQEIITRTEVPKPGPIGEVSNDFSGPNDFSAEVPQGTAGTELAMFDFSYVAAGTGYFANKNKLGHGGFGEVYKGTLPGGEEIAVKRLSVKSSQGCEEFKNEITVIAKLQHRNLVRLLGCSVQGEEKLILYEYMPNKSLDSFLFDTEKKAQLDWSKRFNIIEGIARGLLYLHRDSRLRIIHRDLKVSNILLDEEMNPKISDFGMARIFGGNQNEENTLRVVGTYGYMAPEYAMEGLFSLKSDVYSFGVLLLEIITGRRNSSFRATENTNIIKYAWDLFYKGKAIELADPLILNSCSQEQVLRCIHIGMLCVQDSAANRPNMAAVVLMLESDNTTLPMPRQPTITSLRHLEAEIMDGIGNQDVSSNNVTVSVIVGR